MSPVGASPAGEHGKRDESRRISANQALFKPSVDTVNMQRPQVAFA